MENVIKEIENFKPSNKDGLTMCSLFDGSGGFGLAGLLSGITPISASEIEPFPIRVTTKRMPWVKHYGDVSKLHGYDIEPVDIITFGSPCQDMSIAGKREGLDGKRSGLFHQAIRIIKEMRNKYGKPRYIVWENVMGAFSSNKGEDFRCAIEEIAKIADENVSIPKPKKNGNTQDQLWVTGTPLDGDYLTLNTGEFPNEENASTLSQILTGEAVPQKYFLSPKACQGILRRASERGKDLPVTLKTALQNRVKELIALQ